MFRKYEDNQEERLEDIYINKPLSRENTGNCFYIDDKSYLHLNRSVYNPMPFQKLAGVRPYSRETLRETATRDLNKEMDMIFRNKESKDEFYKNYKSIII